MTHAVAVGRDIDSWCTRCKLMLAHTVEAMIGGKITRVHCNTCGSQHAYRPHPPGDLSRESRCRPPGSRDAPRVPRRRRARADKYVTLLSGRDTGSARARTRRRIGFAPNDLILHPSFGLGVVMTLKDRTKIDVMFREGVKTLLHRH